MDRGDLGFAVKARGQLGQAEGVVRIVTQGKGRGRERQFKGEALVKTEAFGHLLEIGGEKAKGPEFSEDGIYAFGETVF